MVAVATSEYPVTFFGTQPEWFIGSKAQRTIKLISGLLFQLISTLDPEKRYQILLDEVGLDRQGRMVTPLQNFCTFFSPKNPLGQKFFEIIDQGPCKLILTVVDPNIDTHTIWCKEDMVTLVIHVVRQRSCVLVRTIHILEDGTVCGVTPILPQTTGMEDL